MGSHFAELPSDARERAKRIATLWNVIDSNNDIGGANPEVLERLRHEVSDCLYQVPPEIVRAEELTAQVLLLISGCGEL
jgi:hypothetical protein